MLASFKAAALLRMKGIVNVAGSPYVVDVVQSVVHEPRELAKWPTEDERSRLVFIVRGIDRGSIARTLCAFAMGDSLPRTRQLDPDAYARFRKAARQFMD
jgi:G3E family GTPase